jgi:hypothetical protein
VRAEHTVPSQPNVAAPVAGHAAHAVEQNSWLAPHVIGTHWPPLTPEPSTQLAAMHAGPEQVVLTTPLVGQARQLPPHERWPAGHCTGWQLPLTSA